MARHLPLLDATQRRAFDQPPTFNRPQRLLFFALLDWATQVLYSLLVPHSRDDPPYLEGLVLGPRVRDFARLTNFFSLKIKLIGLALTYFAVH